MIIVKIWGGLGNQMFQYAAAKALAAKNNAVLKLDVSHFNKQPKDETVRTYRLHVFPNIREGLASDQEIGQLLPNFKTTSWNRLYKKINQLYNFNKHYKIEAAATTAAIELKDPFAAYLDGYWQSEKYFVDQAGIIRDCFCLGLLAQNPALRSIIDLIRSQPSVSMHIRRGDYITAPATRLFHGVMGLDYYENAMAELLSTLGDQLHFFIFSDDIEWCKNHLKMPYPHSYVSTGEDYYDLYLMSICKHNITANSSFSWWGAWLNANPGKKVIAPAKWFSQKDSKDIIPVSWTTK